MEEGLVNISVYDINGSLVEELVNQHKPYGDYTINWNAQGLSSGVYFVQIISNDFAQTRKLMLIK